MEYTRKTFSSERYDIWTNCSRWHNVPEINKTCQLNGSNFKASNVTFSDSNGVAAFTEEIQDAYPKEAGIVKWERTVSLDYSSSSIVITDQFDLENETEDIRLNIMTLPKPRINGNRILLSQNGTTLEILFSENFEAEFETMKLDDKKLLQEWGENIYRISLYAKKSISKGICSMTCKLI